MDVLPANTELCRWCNQVATGSHGGCWHHDDDFAEARSEYSRMGARAKGNGELRKLKAEVKSVIADVKAGKLDRNIGTTVLQGYRVLRDLIELERRVKETDELAVDIQAIREELEI